jgi:hypothetical protein
MRISIAAVLLALTLAACGPGPAKEGEASKPKASAAKSARALPTGPVLTGVGAVISLEGSRMVLDHEAVPGGLAAGRTTFQADAAVIAEAPIEPGARVAFSYQDWTPEPLLVELKKR